MKEVVNPQELKKFLKNKLFINKLIKIDDVTRRWNYLHLFSIIIHGNRQFKVKTFNERKV